LLFASSTVTTSGLPSVEPAKPAWLSPDVSTIWVAGPTLPVAVNVTGDPERPVATAATLFAPAVVPSVSVVCVKPDAFVVPLVGATLPPPPVTPHVTFTPETGLLFASRTVTTNALPSADPAVLLWLFPDAEAIWVAAPTVPVAVNVTGEPVRPVAVAV